MVTWISFALGFIASPIATRIFVPGELGKVNLFGTYAALISSVCYLGLDQAFVRFFREPPGKVSRKALYTFCIAVPLGFSLLSALALSFFWQELSAQVVAQPNPSIFIYLCIYSFALVLFRFLSLCYRMEQNARLYTIQGVTQVLITKIAYLAVGFGDARGEAAVLSLTVLMTVFSLICLLCQRSRFKLGFAHELNAAFQKDIWRFALPLVPLSLLSWLNSNVNLVVLNNLMGLSEASIYSSALGLAASINIIQTGFNAYYAPYVLEHYQDDSTRFFTIHRLMACLLTLFGLTLSLLQAPVFLLLGKAYRSSVVYFPFLFLSPICYCLGETTGMGITIAKKTHWTTIIFLASAVVNLLLCFVLIPLMGMAGAAAASAVTAIVTLILRTVVGEKYYRVVKNYGCLCWTIVLMLAASVGNLVLDAMPLPKYLLLAGLLALACFLYRHELRTLFTTLNEILFARRGKERS